MSTPPRATRWSPLPGRWRRIWLPSPDLSFPSSRGDVTSRPPESPFGPQTPPEQRHGADAGLAWRLAFYDTIRRRRMVRAFTSDPVEDAVLERVLAAALRAPSAGHSQGVDLVVLRGDDVARYWTTTLAEPTRFRWQGLLVAPVLVLPVVSPTHYTSRYSEADKAATGLGSIDAWSVPYWWVDGGAAVENLLLACVAEGLGACFFGQFEHEEAVRTTFGIPDGRRCVGTIALGHPAPDEPGRSATRPRRTDQVHRGGW